MLLAHWSVGARGREPRIRTVAEGSVLSAWALNCISPEKGRLAIVGMWDVPTGLNEGYTEITRSV